MNRLLSLWLSLLLLSLLSSCSSPAQVPDKFDASLATVWNQHIFETAVAEDGLLTLKGLRTAAMAHLAMHNALNAIVPVYETYQFQDSGWRADPLVTASMAAFTVAMNQYPEQDSLWKAIREETAGDHLSARILRESEMLGKFAADFILQSRNGDGWDGEAAYTFHPMAPGVYAEFNEHSGTPEGFIFGAGWAKAQPFMLPAGDHFRSPPPPAIGSDAYTEAFNEVKELGASHSNTRTADQAHLAMWWKDFVENSHNRLARELVEAEQLNLWEASRLFALLNMSIYDAYICVFDNKFHYNHWRPYTAIRWAAHDDNPDTAPDTSWTNLHNHTYAFPSYPSAHGTASAAAMTVMAHGLENGDNHDFTMTTATVDSAGPFSGKMQMQPPTRRFSSFSEAAMEASMSRLYLGIHFRYDSEEGFKLGSKVGKWANEDFLQKR